MCKSLMTITAALAILSLGSLAASPVQAGNGAPGGASKYNGVRAANVEQVGRPQAARAAALPITEFSSSSAKSSVPKR